jgi:pimeloyl-ACP methyl ester carboxylesterase
MTVTLFPCGRGHRCAQAEYDPTTGEKYPPRTENLFCEVCRAHIADRVRDLPTVYRELRAQYGIQPVIGSDDARVHTSRVNPSIPVREDLDALLTEIETTVAGYEDRVRQHLSMPPAPVVSWERRAARVDRVEARPVGERRDLIVVGHSYGGFTAPLVADRLPVEVLVLVAGMIPAPGEKPADWWDNTGYAQAVQEQARRDGGLTGHDDPFVVFYHDVPRDLAEQALSKERSESETAFNSPWPLAAWPPVDTKFVVCTEDRFFPAEFMRRVVAERLGVVPDEIAAGHCVALSRPHDLASLLDGYVPARVR